MCKLLLVNVLEWFKTPTELSASDLKIVLNQLQSDSIQLFLKSDPETDFRSLEVIQTRLVFNGSSNAFLPVGISTENVQVHLIHVECGACTSTSAQTLIRQKF